MKKTFNFLITSSFVFIFLLLSTGCKKREFDINLVTVKSMEVGTPSLSQTNNITITAKAILLDRNSYINKFDVGFCWSLHPNPTYEDYVWSPENPYIGPFTCTIEHLEEDTLYYIRPYVKYNSEIVYGDEISFNTPEKYEKAVGEEYQGGYVAYIFQPGDPTYVANEFHGLIVSPANLSDEIKWSGTGGFSTVPTSTEIGTGAQNTTLIVNNYSASSPNYAAKICNDLILNGYSDWFLPSYKELKKIVEHRGPIPGFTGQWYWSSSVYDNYEAYSISIYNNNTYHDSYSYLNCVRAVRQF